MMVNLELGEQIMICKPRSNDWGWMIYKQTSNGQMQSLGCFTDPAKVLVLVGVMMFEKSVPGTPRDDREKEWAEREKDHVVWRTYQPEIAVSVRGHRGEKITWSTQKARDEIKKDKTDAKTLEEIAR